MHLCFRKSQHVWDDRVDSQASPEQIVPGPKNIKW